MTEPKTQTVADAAQEWIDSPEGKGARDRLWFLKSEIALTDAFAAGVAWMTAEINEARRKAGDRH